MSDPPKLLRLWLPTEGAKGRTHTHTGLITACSHGLKDSTQRKTSQESIQAVFLGLQPPINKNVCLQLKRGQTTKGQMSLNQPPLLAAQTSLDQLRSVQMGSGQPRPVQASPDQFRPAQTSSGQPRPVQASPDQFRPVHTSSKRPQAGLNATAHVNTTQVHVCRKRALWGLVMFSNRPHTRDGSPSLTNWAEEPPGSPQTRVRTALLGVNKESGSRTWSPCGSAPVLQLQI